MSLRKTFWVRAVLITVSRFLIRKRYRENTERMQTGDILEVAAVVRNLVRTDRAKPLSTGEKKLLGTAKQILESELIYSGGYTMDEADELVESNI